MGKLDKDIYNAIPVYYCKLCLSLRIKNLPGSDNINFCDNCNSTNVSTSDIFTWQEMYKERYGNYLINLGDYGREQKN